jgi:alpha-N-arabinofuranosidase
MCYPSFLGLRQKDYSFKVNAGVDFKPANENECGGVVLFQNHENHLTAEIVLKDGKKLLQIRRCVKGAEQITSSVETTSDLTTIELQVKHQKATAYLVENNNYKLVEADIDLLPYTTEEAGGFVGCTVGMYTSSNGKDSNNHCDFAWLTLEKI